MRWILLLVSSYYFYMCWNVNYIILIFASTVIDYFAGIWIYRTSKKLNKLVLLSLSLISNLGILFTFKYYGFFSKSTENLLGVFNIGYHFPELDILLPVGISFYTFQTLSYTIDIYRGITIPERHFGRFALYVSYFPQLVAGPIERSYQLLPQLRNFIDLNYSNVRDGLLLMTFGFFKKVVIADRLAEYVNLVYNNPGEYGGFSSLIATYFFSFQIYCDFSGYSDIAIGAALVMGVRLMTNFSQPYFSRNIGEFWSRWHISLSTWFRDYLYIPLGGNRLGKGRWYFNLLFVFIVSGLWHGAGWNFVIWGFLHGIYLVFTSIFNSSGIGKSESKDRRKPSPIRQIFQIVLTYHLVLLGWVFFRSSNYEDALLILNNIRNFGFDTSGINLFRFPIDFSLSIILIGVLTIVEYLQVYKNLNHRLVSLPWIGKLALLMVGIGSILLLGKFDGADFLYFQF
ncbi:MBOAT family protein [Aquiflexum sp. TKW24L]|uniref:MBOAT family O-acyltransferase n=1 Tax=Aquiflexum sp. TKW24L TaxID=2942212 RepID=UPI0020BF27B8|nr:MBOAT family O-acyltransferase [Aquiflexum sp. TKW24L]MCL6257706.1 MBOAT family protein [Aquiflexum sp. TKW24L]